MTPAVAFCQVSRHFGIVRAVDAVDLEIFAGEFFAMLGPSGSGKTTCLRLIAGFEQPTAGHIEIFGETADGVPPYRRNVNTVFQDYALFPHLDVLDNVAYGLMVRGVGKTARLAAAEEALALVQLPGYGERRPSQLSGGQRQRVALARALVNKPRALLLDEPLGALDLKLREQMQEELKVLQRSLGITFVFVTHDQGEALSMADRIAVFNDGKVMQIGTPDDIYRRPSSRFVADFVGSSNVLPPEFVERLCGKYDIETSPCDRLKPARLIGPKEPRQRVLTDDELRAFCRAADRLGYPFGPMFKLLVLTGQRKSEVAEARWREFDLDGAVWTVPPERFKSNSSHLVPLTNDALAVLRALPRFKKGDHLFSTTFGEKPVSGFSKAKARLDRFMLRTLKALARTRGEDPAKVTLPPFVIHDIRRTMRTRLSGLKVQERVAEMVIGHGKKGLARVYDQHEFADEMREALDLWAARLRSIVSPPPVNVVNLERARAVQ